MMIKCVVIPADGREQMSVVEYAPDDLKFMQKIVGGYIDAVNLYGPEANLFVNEEGLLMKMPYNRRATNLAGLHGAGVDCIVGCAFVAGPPGDDGWNTSVPDYYLKYEGVVL